MKVLVALLTTIVMFVLVALSPILSPRTTSADVVVSHLLPTVAALALLFLYRRFADRRPWSSLRTAPTRWSIPQFLLGAAVGLGTLLLANALAVWVGAATWGGVSTDQGVPYALFLFPVLIAFRAGYPEELLFRGHLFDVLSDRYRQMTVLVITSVSFGALHIVSQSAAEGIVERLLYVLMAIGFGFLCGTLRMRTGTVWAAAGMHSSLYYVVYFPTQEINFGVQLIFQTVLFALAAAAVLMFPGRRLPSAALPG
ncbi:CPBP family intramembrane glutamic endopeptidase [Nonomuraea typhae]|uniref:CPBP family intramembrane glutamic endopeptidase n=1 Tax=Nonomuraea typhae TaxID=2603600 RepID=UPI0012F8E167|nr:type II CAAX endopeptidase family protein [Nonomuraea typhae]